MRKIGYVVALMLCITLAVAPAIASSFTLGIYGNAHMDEDSDEKDIADVEGVIKEQMLQQISAMPITMARSTIRI
jgi:hypothetical protein